MVSHLITSIAITYWFSRVYNNFKCPKKKVWKLMHFVPAYKQRLSRVPQKNWKASRNKALQQKSHQMYKYQCTCLFKVLGIIPKIDNREELRQIDQMVRKLMTTCKAFHSWDDMNRLFVSSKRGGRGRASVENCVDTWTQGHVDYIKKSKKD